MQRFNVDFNARDEDDAVRLSWSKECQAMDGTVVPMIEGLKAYITDDEVAAIGRMTFRDGIWVVVVSRWLGHETGPISNSRLDSQHALDESNNR